MRALSVDTHFESTLAHEVVFKRITDEYIILRNLIKRPAPFFFRAVKDIKGRHRSRPKRTITLESLVSWVRWGEIARSAVTGTEDPAVHKRLVRSSKCAPAGVRIEADYFRRCELYACPMCWYRHVRDRLQFVNRILNTQTLGAIVRIQGISKAAATAFPPREKYMAQHALAAALRDKIQPEGSIATVLLRGKPGDWHLDIELITSGVDADKVRKIVAKDTADIDWGVFSFTGRNQALLRSIAQCLEYPAGLFHADITPMDLRTIFSGPRLYRSKVTGIFSKR